MMMPFPSFPLTDREIEVLQALADTDTTTAAVAERLYISPATVRNHLGAIYSKLGAATRAHALVLGLEQRLIHLPERTLTS